MIRPFGTVDGTVDAAHTLVNPPRRSLLIAAAGAALLPSAHASSASSTLALTPAQDEGPYYPRASFFLTRSDVDADLLTVAGARETSRGVPLALSGRVLNTSGQALEGASVEIWQCDARGQYAFDMPSIYRTESGFQGFGRTITDAQGNYGFRTIRPVPYSGRPPHIHVKVWSGQGAQRKELLTTQMYVRGEVYANDFVLSAIRNNAARERLIAHLAARGNELTARWDIVVSVS